jgi:hypothetical protein
MKIYREKYAGNGNGMPAGKTKQNQPAKPKNVSNADRGRQQKKPTATTMQQSHKQSQIRANPTPVRTAPQSSAEQLPQKGVLARIKSLFSGKKK